MELALNLLAVITIWHTANYSSKTLKSYGKWAPVLGIKIECGLRFPSANCFAKCPVWRSLEIFPFSFFFFFGPQIFYFDCSLVL